MKQIKKTQLVFLIAFFIAFVGLKVWQYHWPKETIAVKGQTLEVLVARDPAHHKRGLSGMESLDPHDGMLFVHGIADRYAFVPKDVRFSVDVVWLHNGEVVEIAPHIDPADALPEYQPRKEANTVLVLNAGIVEQYDVKIGDMVEAVDE
jgi:uncharacterized protein